MLSAVYFVLTSLLHFTFHPCFSFFFLSYLVYNMSLYFMYPYISLEILLGTEKGINKLSTGHLPLDNLSAPQTAKSYQTELIIFTPLPPSPLWSRWDLPLFAISINSNIPVHRLHKLETRVSCYFWSLLSFNRLLGFTSVVSHSLLSIPSTMDHALATSGLYCYKRSNSPPAPTLPFFKISPP